MRLVIIADGNSPLARQWIKYLTDAGDDVHLISHYRLYAPPIPGVRAHEVPLMSARFFGLSSTASVHREPSHIGRLLSAGLRGLNSALDLHRAWIGYVGPLEARFVAPRIASIVHATRPHLVHALRIPMEGESVARLSGPPVALSAWGNDFTLWTARYRGHRRLAAEALRHASGLHADCQRDIQLARELGFPPTRPHLVSPSGGGIDASKQVPADAVNRWRTRLALPPEAAVVVNPRGMRTYVRTNEYLRAIPDVLRERPATVFVSVGVAGDPTVTRLTRELGIDGSHRALPTISQDDLAALFVIADVTVSPTDHDGTPNTLLEAMARGAFPVAGNLESIREWIDHGFNGLLVDATSPSAIAAGILRALGDPDLRVRGVEHNRRLVRERADYAVCMGRVRQFYREIVHSAQRLT